MKYPLAINTWDDREIEAAKTVLDSGMYTMGKVTQAFEEEFSGHFGGTHAIFCNSGSSANLLAIAGLCLKKDGLKRGDEVVVPAVSWSTTFTPLGQYGLKLVFVDVNEHDFNINVDRVKEAITKKTRAVMVANLLGMPCDLRELKKICEENDLFLIEDNCESMGAKLDGQYCGTFGEAGTFSTFFSHHMCTVEGGVAMTSDEELHQVMLCVRSHGWTRNLPPKNLIEDKTGNKFHDSFRFVLPGYNLRSNDIFAAVGMEQLKKIDDFVRERKRNWEHMNSLLKDSGLDGSFKLQEASEGKEPSWFGFGFVCEGVDREKVMEKLSASGVECRPIVAGNFCKSPAVQYMDHRIHGDLNATNKIDSKGFFVGNNGTDISESIDYLIDILVSLT